MLVVKLQVFVYSLLERFVWKLEGLALKLCFPLSIVMKNNALLCD